MKVFALIASIILVTVLPAQSYSQNYGLPSGALIVEKQEVKSSRLLILWMLNPIKHPREMSPEDNPYTCPEETRGHYYSGRTRVSLVNLKTHKIINTVSIKQEYWEEGEDSFDIPYIIRRGSYYHVEGVSEGNEGKPTIMWLRDYNGDGKAQEFALFDALACMGLQTTLIGYSERQDKVIQYLVNLRVKGEENRTRIISHWADYLFSIKPCASSFWRYEIDYRGRGGSLDAYQIRYNPRKEQFEGLYKWTTEAPKNPTYYSDPRRCLTTHSTGLAISRSFISQVDSSPVNSGDRHAAMREENGG